MRKSHLSWSCGVLLLSLAGCGTDNTYVLLRVLAGASTPSGVKTLDCQFTLNGQTAGHAFMERNGGDIAFPTDATIQILHGAGPLNVLVIARNAAGVEVDRGSAATNIAEKQISTVTVQLGVNTMMMPDLGKPSDAASGDALVGPATLTVDALMHDYQMVELGASATFTLHYSNQGGAATGALSGVVSGSNAEQFTLVNDGCSGNPLAPGAQCTVDVVFKPAGTPGGRGASLVMSAVPGGSLTTILTGTVKPQPVLTVAQAGNGSGKLTVQGATCAPPPCNGSYPTSTMVTIVAAPDPSSIINWTGCTTIPNTNTCVVTVDGAKMVTATFSLKKVTLTINLNLLSGQGGTVGSENSGTAQGHVLVNGPPQCSPPCVCLQGTCTYPNIDYGTTVALTAAPDHFLFTDHNGLGIGPPTPPWADLISGFQGWSDPGCGQNQVCNFQMIGDRTMGATFTPYNTMFATSVPATTTGTGTCDQRGGSCWPTGGAPDLAWADTFCNTLAAQGLGTDHSFHYGATTLHYRAWISTASVGAKDRLAWAGGAGLARGWVRTDGTPFTDSVTSMISAPPTIYSPPIFDETVTQNVGQIATGTASAGGTGTSATCHNANDWAPNGGTFTYGLNGMTSSFWNNHGTTTCPDGTKGLRIYCFQTDFNAALIPPVPHYNATNGTGPHVAFVSKGDYKAYNTGMSTLATADSLCQSEAVQYGFAPTGPTGVNYVALLPTFGATAASRLAAWTGKIYRSDGVLLVGTPSDLVGPADPHRMFSNLDVQSDGQYTTATVLTGGGDPQTTTGSGLFGGGAGNTCSDWGGAGGNGASAPGATTFTFFLPSGPLSPKGSPATWFDDGSLPGCLGTNKVYCFRADSLP
jgi:hypothetical protein